MKGENEMPNTFLNTGRVMQATGNPNANVESVNNNVQNNIPQSNNANNISPITIPIQIQPQVANAGVSQSNDFQSLQVNNMQRANTNVNSAPTPQSYNANNTNTNVVDFNQIYSSYQSQYGNGNGSNNTSSGIKRTSLGTTIVTPTTKNINSIEGQYQSAYADTVNGLIGEMLTQLNDLRNGNFNYDPSADNNLKLATEYAANSTLQSLAGSGVLNSSATAERISRIVSELIPQYEQKAYDRQLQYLGQLANTAQVVMNYDNQQFQYWKDAKDREFQNKQFEYQKKQDELNNAWKRVDELGYVDNNASAVLGVPVGTLSGEARLAKEQQEFELKKMREQLAIQYENDKAIYKLRNELEKEQLAIQYQNERSLYQYKNELSKDQTKYEYELSNKYGNSKSSSSNKNYTTYDEIIKNRYAKYDELSKQYTVPNKDTYIELVDYLDSLYFSGAITEDEFLKLSAKYSTYSKENNVSYSNTTNTTKAGLNDDNVSTWIKALDGNNKALDTLGVTIWGQKKSNVNNNDAKKAVREALHQINEGKYKFTTNQQLMNDLKNHKFGKLGWGL